MNTDKNLLKTHRARAGAMLAIAAAVTVAQAVNGSFIGAAAFGWITKIIWDLRKE